MKKIFIAATLLTTNVLSSTAGTDPFSNRTIPQLKDKKTSFSSSRGRTSDNTIGVGGHASFLKLFGSGGSALIGIGINGLYSSDGERNAFFGDFTYYFPGKITGTSYANAYSSTTSPSQIEINTETKITTLGLRIGYRRYLINDVSEEGFKAYLNVAAGLLMIKGTTVSTTTTYDVSLYDEQFEPTVSLSGFTIGGGIGAEYSLASKVNLFCEANINVPANTVNGAEVEVEIPIFAQILIGARYHF